MDQSVIPECYVDTNLIETIVPAKGQYNHQKGCGTVTRVMQEKFADRFAVGIIDKDKREVAYLKEFNEVHTAGSLILHKHKARHHYIIQINPAMERFILYNAEAADINVADYGLPNDFDQFKRESKKVNTKDDPRFKRLFSDMHKAGVDDLQRLAAWITVLRQHTYNVDLASIIAL